MRRVKLIILITCVYIYATGQNPKWKNYTNGDKINCLISEGDNIWVGTDGGGLVRINDLNCQTIFYNKGNSDLPSNIINTIAIDKKGNKWIGTELGLAKFDGIKWSIYKNSNSGLPYNKVKGIAIKDDNEIWIISEEKMVYLDFAGYYYNSALTKFDGNKWTNLKGLGYGELETITIDQQGNKWIGTVEHGIIKYDGKEWTEFNNYNYNINLNDITSTIVDADNNLWIVGYGDYRHLWGRIVKYNGKEWTQFNVPEDKGSVTSIAIDADKKIWIGQSYFDFRKKDFRGSLLKVDESKFINNDIVDTNIIVGKIKVIEIDKKGNKWIGTEKGLFKFDGRKCIAFKTSNSSMPRGFVNTIALDSNENPWIGTNLGLIHQENNKWEKYTIENSKLTNDFISAIAIDSKGNKWIGIRDVTIHDKYYPASLIKFDGKNWVNYSEQNFIAHNDEITRITIDSTGNKWIGTFGGALIKIDVNNRKDKKISNLELDKSWINDIYFDKKNNLWIGADKGLLRYDGKKWKEYNQRNSKLKDEEEIRTISSYNNGEVLILSQSRLYKIGKRSRLKDIKIPSNSDFHGMVFDSKGNIWIAGRAGISKYDFKSWTNYNEDNSGLTDNYILSITIDNYDNIWIGTEKGGVCVFNENGIK